ncbi:hypothetical protein G3O08_18585 [Cryomorpha ignava]|uniref:AraC effector-binding domain-containing protein n=1 Tax=Cryomorpha ignava TaxID=101383 RepID=A0A7K3WUZ0_9FLAO|nr:SRPBCC family protein [Cryomorpha ignava]NEN25503.1 hypothetical protein [Cryomorpha ignava]
MKTFILPLAIGAMALSSCSPTNYQVEREITIDAPSDLVFSLVNNHKERDAWSPWEAMDANMTKSYEGPESGVGALYKWTGNDSVGTGWMEILESEPNNHIKSKLVFTEPFQSESTLNWNFTEVDGKTTAVWTMNGELPGYLFWMGQDEMEEQMAPDFEKGLANLKRVAEEKLRAMKPNSNLTAEIVTVESKPYYYSADQLPISSVNAAFFEERYGKLMAYIGEDGQKNMLGAPFAIFSVWDEENNLAEIEVAVACKSTKPGKDKIKKGDTYAGEVLKCQFMGPYENTGEAHEFINKYASDNNLEITGSPWEVYVTDPANEPDQNKWITEVYYPIKKG